VPLPASDTLCATLAITNGLRRLEQSTDFILYHDAKPIGTIQIDYQQQVRFPRVGRFGNPCSHKFMPSSPTLSPLDHEGSEGLRYKQGGQKSNVEITLQNLIG
jgi:hypothetical protein